MYRAILSSNKSKNLIKVSQPKRIISNSEDLDKIKETIKSLENEKIDRDNEIIYLKNLICNYEKELQRNNEIIDDNFKVINEEEEILSKIRKENISLKQEKVNKNEILLENIIKENEKILKSSSRVKREISSKPKSNTVIKTIGRPRKNIHKTKEEIL